MPGKTRRPMLKMNSRGAAVSKLQEMLRQLDYTINDRPGFFGADTRDAIMDLQSKNDLRPTGIAGQKVLQLIQKMLKERERVDDSPSQSPEKDTSAEKKQYRVKGTVKTRRGTGAGDVTVRAYDRDMRCEQLLGECKTNKKGEYEITYASDQFARSEKKAADLLCRAYNWNEDALYEPDLNDVRFNASEKEIIDISLSKAVEPKEDEFTRLVNSIVPLIDRVPIAELREDETHQDIIFLKKETNNDPERIEHLIVAHRLHDEANIPAAFFYGLLRKNTLLKLDVSQLFSTRLSININSELKPLLYDAALLDADTIKKDINEAVVDKTVPAEVGESLDSILSTLQGYRDSAEAYEAQERPQKVLSIIANLINKEKIGEFQSLLEGSKHDLQGFLTKLSSNDLFASTSDEADATVNLQLAGLLGFDTKVVESVKRAKGIGDGEDIRKLARLNKRDWSSVLREVMPVSIARVDESLVDFHSSILVRKMEKRFPTDAFAAQLSREAQGRLNYQSEIASFLEQYPDFDLLHSNVDLFIKDRSADLSGNEPLKGELKAVQRVFRLVPHYSKSLSLRSQKVSSAQDIIAVGKSRFLNEVAPKAGLSRQEAKKAYAKAERINTASMIVVGELQDTRNSMEIMALKSTSVPKKLEAVSKDFPNLKSLFKQTDMCECQHCRSVYSPAAYLVEILQFLDKRSVVAIGSGTMGRFAKDVLFERRPDLGDIDLSCENANTPLPYIDLVCEILEEAVAPDHGAPYHGSISTGNVPSDLMDILLQSHDMPVTNKAIIYEPDSNGHYILRDEKAVCKLIDQGGDDWIVQRLRQTHGTAEELDAAPEYVNSEAYAALKNANYAFGLPFDLDHTEATAYFERFGVSRVDLMGSFQVSGSAPSDADIAAERLGLTQQEYDLIVSDGSGNQDSIWNIDSADVIPEMSVVDRFLTKSGLTYNALNVLLQLEYIDPDNELFIEHLDVSCDTNMKVISGLNEDALDRMHRFLRLKKKTGWSMEFLDNLISQDGLGGKSLSGTSIKVLADLVRLSDISGVKLDDLIGCYGAIPHLQYRDSGYTPLYQKVFLNKAANGFLDDALRPESIDGTKLLASVRNSVSVALQISEQDFDLLIDHETNGLESKTTGSLEVDGANAPVLSFRNLSLLFAISRFAKALRLSIKEFLILLQLTDIDAFTSPETTQAFVEHVKRATTSSPINVEDTRYILKHEADDLITRSITDEKVLSILAQFQLSYQQVFEANRLAFDEELTIEELIGSVSLSLSKLPAGSDVLVNDVSAMVDGDWSSLSDAQSYIDEALSEYFDTTAIQNSLQEIDDAISDLEGYQAALDAAETSGNVSAIQNAKAEVDSAYVALEEKQKGFMKGVVEQVARYLTQYQAYDLLAVLLAESFKAGEEIVDAVISHGRLKQPGSGVPLLVDVLLSEQLIDTANIPAQLPAIDAAAFPEQFQSVRLLHKLIPLVSSLAVTADEAVWLLDHDRDLNWMEMDAIPYETGHDQVEYSKWEELVQGVSLMKTLTPVVNPADANTPVTFQSVMEMLTPESSIDENGWLDSASLLTGYDRDMFAQINTHFSYTSSGLAAYKNIAAWEEIGRCIEFQRKLGVTVGQILDLVKPSLTHDQTMVLRTALKSKYSDELWLTTLGEIMDAIRPQKRDALVAFLLAENSGMKSSNDLYDYFLVDVEMEACMPSSRIVQAHGAIQLFVQRCLMGVEPSAAADTSDLGWDQWKWMRNYRVWEANRKVFLYPENWIEPELLDDKSYMFSDLENELQQNEINEFTTEEALIGYLEKLDDTAFLEVVASYYQTDNYTMHVFARTKGGDPAQYFYRRFEKERYWTPWEKIELDITSDHLIAFQRNSRLHLAWPLFSEESDPKQKATVPDMTSGGGEQEIDKANRKLKIQLAISELANGYWKPKKLSKDAVMAPENYTNEPKYLTPDHYSLLYNNLFDQIIVIYSDDLEVATYESHKLLGAFNITGCKGYPELAYSTLTNYFEFYPDFYDGRLTFQRYAEQNFQDDSDSLLVRKVFDVQGYRLILNNTPGNYRITYPLQFTGIDFLAFLFFLMLGVRQGASLKSYFANIKIPLGTGLPYFFEDSEHAYSIVPGLYGEANAFGTPEKIQTKRTVSDWLALLENIRALMATYAEKFIAEAGYNRAKFLADLSADQDFIEILEELYIYAQLTHGEQFKNLYHPMMCKLRSTLYKDGVSALMSRDTQLPVNDSFSFDIHYGPNMNTVPTPYPVENIDFDSDGSYSSYNWELFYHIPLLIAGRLTRDQKFEDALTWYHYIFNPTGSLEGTAPQKYWVTKPFYERQEEDYIAQRIDSLLYKIADPNSGVKNELEFAIDEWRTKPFRPHTVARFRTVAYQKTVLMKYIDNLIEWGDYNFRQDTMESIVQATQMYILADKLLGPKPRIVPPAVKVPYQTYNQIEVSLDGFGNALVELENILPDLSVMPEGGEELPAPLTLSSLYFCVPQNDKMLEYWDRIEDRLFKIRNCQNIDGVERSLALFAPPIDPGMLVKAAAAGLDISSVLSGLNVPLPYYRFNILVQKATELTQEVRSLGSSLLQALEKKDAEEMALLRSGLEIKVLKAVRDMKQLQIDEAKEQIESLKKTRAVTEERNNYYANIEKISSKEQLNLDKLAEAHGFQNFAQIAQAAGAISSLLPDISIGGHGAGGSPAFHATWGGLNLANAANAAASVSNIFAGMASYEANRASTLGGYGRRFDDWKLQERLSEKELKQIDQQVVAAEIRLNISETDLKNHDLQIENAEKTDQFMKDKYTNKQLYDWMIGQVSSVYFKAYQLAYDVAKKAERCYQHELGRSDSFLKFGYWDSLKKGLQSADHLFHDIQRMDVAYLDVNKREYELTKHVSLASLDPVALIRLKNSGECYFEIPEVLFDMDHPGHYFRRIKSVSISMPCIAGPYTSVCAKLSLISNKYRKSTAKAQVASSPKEEYEEIIGNDDRFAYNIGSIQSIATSSAQNDSGMFELNFRDERYLPFEGTGAISSWRLELPTEVRQFDYNTISDVIVHVKYTSREGGSSLRGISNSSLKAKLDEVQKELGKTGMHCMIDVRRDMPDDWNRLKNNGSVDLMVSKSRLPYFAQVINTTSIESISFIASTEGGGNTYDINIDGSGLSLNLNGDLNMLVNDLLGIQLDTLFKFEDPNSKLVELLMVVKYTF